MKDRVGDVEPVVELNGYGIKSLFQLSGSTLCFGLAAMMLALGFQWVANDWAFHENRYFWSLPVVLCITPVVFFQGLRSVNSYVRLTPDGEVSMRNWPQAPIDLRFNADIEDFILFDQTKESLFTVFLCSSENSEPQKMLRDIRIDDRQRQSLEKMSFVRMRYFDQTEGV